MLLTSWIRALRQSFTRHRLSRARRKQADARRQSGRHARMAEVLEERSLLSIRPLVIDINQLTGTNVFTSSASAPAINITNSLLDPNSDGISDYDDLLIGVSQSSTFESTVITGTGVGIRINLSNLRGLNHIAIDNVIITAGANQQGISITLDNVALQSLSIDQTNVTPAANSTGGTGLDINLKNMSSTAGVDVSIQNSIIRSGSPNFNGVNVTLESVSRATHVGELTLADSTVEGMSVTTSANSILYATIDQASARSNRIQNGAANPVARGITYNLNRTSVGDLRVENNLRLRNVSVTTTDSPLKSVSISNNSNLNNPNGGFDVSGFGATDTDRDAIRLFATSTNAAGTLRSDVTNLRIVNNTITGSLANTNAVNGISLSMNDSNLGDYAIPYAGARIAGNTIRDLSGTANSPATGIVITGAATTAFVTKNGGRPLLLDFDGDGTANDTNGITQNTLVNNNGRGLVVTGKPDTSFVADVTANTIQGGAATNRREGVVINTLVRPTLAGVNSFSLNFSDNTIDGSQGSGVSLALQDNAIGSFVIRNNEFTNMTAFPVASNVVATNPNGLSIVLEGTNTNQEAKNVLLSSLIEGNFVGITRTGIAGPNAANGIFINSQEASIIQDLRILNNSFRNNGTNATHAGLQILREDKANMVSTITGSRAVTISGNTFGQNRNGMQIDARNGSIDLLDFGITNNFIGVDANGLGIGNIDDGINIRTQADARVLADISENQIRFNQGNGINLNDRFDNFSTDKRQIGGTWINNTISENLLSGIQISGRHGLSDETTGVTTPLLIGQEGRGNLIENNGRNGIQIFGLVIINTPQAVNEVKSTATGEVAITNNIVRANARTGIFVVSSDEKIDIRHNQIESNRGKGIDLQLLRGIPTLPSNNGLRGVISATIRDNVVTNQTNNAITGEHGDGIELSGFEIVRSTIGIAENNDDLGLFNALIVNNFVDSNEGRGLDILNVGAGTMQLRIGDGTDAGRNTIIGNNLDGIRVVNTPERNQHLAQDTVPTAAQPLGVTRNVVSPDAAFSPDIMLDVSKNTIRDNGIGLPDSIQTGGVSEVNGSGLVLLASGVGQGANPIGIGLDFYPNEVGANSGNPNAGNGRVNLRVTNNTFEGNFGNDFVIAPYTAVIPPTTTGVWTTTQYGFSMYLDPLIRINAVVTGNTGNGMDVIRPAPEYTNSEPVFKSRLRPPTAPPGPFIDGSRPRNATRLAVDGNPVAPALGFEFVYPGIDERAYNVQTGDASLQLNNTFISQGPNANTPITTLRVESGFDQSGTTAGFAFYSPSSPGPGSDDNFDDTARLIANGLLPVINGRIDVLWDSVSQGSFTFPNVDSPTYVFPTVRNFPILGNSTPGTITVDFSEYVRFVDISDFRLFRNNVAVSLAALAVSPVNSSEDPNNPGAFRSFTLDLSSVTALPGNYEFQVLAVNPSDPSFTAIRDVHSQFNNQGNPLTRVTDGAGVLQNYALSHLFTIDNSRPVGSITPITPDPRNAAAGIVTVTFSEPVTGVDITDFQLFSDSGLGPVPVNLGSITLTALSSTEYTLNLNQLTGAPGTYELRLVTTDLSTPIQDAAGNLVAENFAVGIASSDTWLVDTTLPFVTSIADDLLPDIMINSPVNAHPSSIIVNFSEAVSGVDNSDFTLLRTNEDGTVDKIDISSALTYPLFQLTPSQYELNLLALPLVPGTYRITINPLNSGITDTAGNAFLTSFAASWVLDIAQPLADIVDVAPDPRQTPVDALNTIFTEKVNGVNLLDASTQYVLAFDDGTAATTGPISDATNAGPILVTSTGHNLLDGERITIHGVTGNTNANGVFIAKNPVGDTFELWYLDNSNVLQPVFGNGIYVSGGRWVRTIQLGGTVSFATNAGPIVITSTNHGLTTGTKINLSGVVGNTAANGVFTITRIDANSFSLNGSSGNGVYTSGGTWVRTTSTGSSLLSQQTDTRYVLNLATVTLNQGTYVVSLLANSGITDDAGNEVGPAADQFNVAAQDIWANGPDSPPTGIITPIVTPRGTNAGIVTVTFSEPLAKINNASPVDFRDFMLTRTVGLTTTNISLTNVPIKQTGPTTYTLDLSASGLTDIDGTYTLQLLNSNAANPDTVSPLKDLNGNLLSDDSDPSTAVGIASQIVWTKSSALSGPQVTGFIDEQRGIALGSITKLRPVETLTINFSVPVTGIDLTDASRNFLLTRQATGGVPIPVSLEGIAVQQVTTQQYRISLSTLTGTDGTYRFTVLANGLIKNTDAVPVELKNPQTVTWIKDGTMRPSPVGDSVDSNQGNEVVGNGSSYSLRQAIQEANALPGDDVIELGSGTYTLSLAGVQEDLAASGDLDIRQNLVIRGKGVGVTIIDASALSNQLSATNRDRVFQILAAATVTIQGVTIQRGAVTGSEDGGAIRNTGNLTILDSLIQNSTSQDDGGAINNTGTLTINRTTILNNTAIGNGGAIRNAGTLFIINSTLSGNSSTGAGGHGGALMNLSTFSATLENVTVSGNTSQNGAGGGIRNDGTLVLINDTIAFNRSLSAGAGISRNLGTVRIGNTIVSNNTLTNDAATPSDVAGTFASVGGNLIQTLGSATGFIGSDQTNNVNPNLLPLGNYGGPTQTHALPAFDATGAQNPAIDRGLNVNVTNQDANTSLDQRGALRFLDGPSNGNSVDVGAFEFGTFFVNTTDDSPDVSALRGVADGLAEDGLRQTSLRAAIMESNLLAGESAIILDGTTYSLKRLAPDTVAPTVLSISGQPTAPITTGGAGVVTITFTERVAGFDLAHIALARNGVPVALSPATFQLTKVSDLVYRIENKADIAAGITNTGLSSVTQTNGLYTLTINPTANVLVNGVLAPTNIRDIENNLLDATNANVSWVRGVDTFAPSVTITPATITNQFIQNAGTVTVTFNEKVTGVSANNFTLTRGGVPVTGLVVTPDPIAGNNFGGRTVVTLNLQTLTALNGNYVLTFNPTVGANVTIRDSANNPFPAGTITRAWSKVEGVRLADVQSTPLDQDVQVGELTKVRLQFTERVAGVKLDNFTLTFDDGSGAGPQPVNLSQATLATFGAVTAVPGFGNAAEQWELTFSNKQAARDGVYVLNFNGLSNGNQLVMTATTATVTVPFPASASTSTATFTIGEDQSNIGDLDVVVGSGRVQIFGKGKDTSSTVLGNTQPPTIIDGNLTDRLFDLTIGANVAISDVEMIRGKVVYERSGGAIRNFGTLTLNDVDLLSNMADGNGGAVYNAAPFGQQVAITGNQFGSPLLTVGVNAAAGTLTLNSLEAFSTNVPFVIQLQSEQMLVTAVNAALNQLTVTRGFNGTVAAGHAANSVITQLATSGSVASDITDVATTLTVSSVASLPLNTPFILLVDSEQMQVTAVNSTTNQLTVVRGVNGTIAASHTANAAIVCLSPTASLTAPITNAATTLTLDNLAAYPSDAPFTILVGTEQMQVTAVNAALNQFTVVRGVNGTAPVAAAQGTSITLLNTDALSATSSTITVTSVAAFPNTAPFVILIDSEQILVTAINPATNQFTVSRGFNGTTATGHAANALVTVVSAATLNRSNLQNNTAGSATSGSSFGKGGAIYNENGAIVINEGSYSNNAAVTDGGVIYNGSNTTASLLSTSFTSNNAGRNGGAIYNNDIAILTINVSTLSGNRADAAVNGVASDSNGDGGAIFNETSAKLVLDDSLLQNNTARNGGALYNDDGTLILNRDTFGVNSALENGGAIVNTSRGSITLNQGLFTTNSAGDDGGAIQNFGNLIVQDVAGTGTQFLSNEAGTDVRPGDTNNGVGGAIFNRDGTVEIHSAVFTLNRSHGDAGAIFNDGDGTLTIQRTEFTRNLADGNGGVLVNNDFAQATVNEVSFSNNVAAANGGAIYNNSEFTSGSTLSLTIDNTTLNNNTAANGGAIFNSSVGGITLTNSTLSANVASVSGGGIANFGTVSLLSDTLYLNDAPVGAGIANNIGGDPPFGPVTLKNTLVAGGTSGADVDGDNFVNGGHNLIQTIGTITAYLPDGSPTVIANGDLQGDIVGQNPQLDILRDNGGPTLTHALLFGSPARDAGDNFGVTLNDQRGLNRVFDGDGNGVATVDIGAFESGFVVNSFLDTVDQNPGDGINADRNGQSTLRAAIMEANARPGEDTIILGPGIFLLTLPGRSEDFRLNSAGNVQSSSETGDLDVLDDLNIIGAGTDLTFIDAAQIDRLFQVFPGVSLKLSNLTLQNGNATSTDFGGAIFNQGSTTLDNVLVINSSAGRGGGIYNDTTGTLTITDSLFRGNQAVQQGGAIYNDGTLTLGNSEIGAASRLATSVPLVTNNLTSALTSAATTFTLTSAGNLPAVQSVIQIDSEMMLVTNVAGTTITVTRGVNGSTAVAHSANAIVILSTTITLSDVSHFPTSGQFVIQVDAERMLVTSILNNTFTVTRGYNGTVATTHTAAAFATLGNVANIHGGGVFNQGDADISRSSFSGNLAQSRGGGLYNGAITGLLTAAITAADTAIVLTKTTGLPTSGTFTIQVDSEKMLVTSVNFLTNTLNVQRNFAGTQSAAHAAGAFATTVGVNSTTITQSTFLDNFASSRGAAIYNEEDLTIQNSTLSNNDSGTNAALGNSVSGRVLIENSTVVDNVAYRGGGLANSLVGTVTVHNTIVANNSSTSISGAKAPNVRGTFTTQGNNFIGNNADSVGFTNNTNFDQVGSGTSPFDPVLKGLTDNGGPTLTHTARTGSPIIDNGNNTGGSPVDQRGAIRPTNSDSDIGSVEIQDVHVTINDVMLKEGNNGSTIFTFTLSLNKPSIQEVRVHYTLQGDTAFAGEDFVDISGDVVFAPNQLNQTLQVVVNGDMTIEPDEQFLVNLSIPSDAAFTPTLDRTQAVGTILSDDTGFRITDVNKVELENGSPDQDYVFTVSIVGAKLAAVPGSLGSAVDAITTTLALGSVTGFPTTVPFTILVDSEQMQVTAVDAGTNEFTVVRGINGTVAAAHAVNATVNRTFIANYSIVDGSATIAGGDYALVGAATGTFVFVAGPNGELPVSQTITVTVKGDNDVEANENFLVSLSSADLPFEFDKSTGIGTIFNDDLGFNVSNASAVEGDPVSLTPMDFVVSLQQPVYISGVNGVPMLATTTASVSTASGTATSDQDFTQINGQVLTFSGATTSQVVSVQVIGDLRYEVPNEVFQLQVTAGTIDGASDSDVVTLSNSGTGTIVDNDPPPDQYHIYTQFNTGTGTNHIRVDRIHIGVRTNLLDVDQATAGPISQLGDFGNVATDDLFVVDFNLYSDNAATFTQYDATGVIDPTYVLGISNPIPVGGLSVDGLNQVGADAMRFQGGGLFNSVEYHSINSGSGSVVFDGASTVNYAGLEPLFDNTAATNRTFNAPVGTSDDNISASASGGIISISGPTFESVTALAPTSSLTINSFGGNDTIQINSSDLSFTATLTVNAGDGEDNVDLSGWALTSTINGGIGNDTIIGGSGNDSVDGGEGADTITGGLGNDTLNGGIGGDSIVAGGGNDLVNGGDGNDTIQGNDGIDTINGGADDDNIDGGAGSETVDGGSGNDTVSGGDGDDTVLGNDGNDLLSGGNGADSVDGGFGDDTMSGDAGNDTINGQGGSLDVFVYTDPTNSDINFTLTATTFTTPTETDTLVNTERAKIVVGNGNNKIDASTFTGSVTMDGAGGNDTLLGGMGNDSIISGPGNDTVTGGDGNDTINGGDGNDTLSGDAGDDQITGDAGTDLISGGAGNDTADGGAGNDVLTGGAGDDTLDGGNDNDTILGGDGKDSLLGGAGQDSIRGENGDDTIDAGDGNDTAFGDSGNDFVGGGTGDDTLQGNLGDDSVNGMDGNDTLDGNAGIDTLFGGAGDDSMISTDGNDELHGQGGSFDTFTFEGDAVIDDIFTITRSGTNFTPATGIGLARLNSGMEFTTIVLGVEIFTLNLNGGNDLVTLGDLEGVLDLTVLNINGGDGNDTIDGSLSTSTTVALNANMGLGNDSVRGGAGKDTILGDAGNDTIQGYAGDDSMDGGDGADNLNGNGGNDTINGGTGNDSIIGGGGHDSLIGLDGHDTILGQAGNDTIGGGLGNDFLDGGYGNSVTGGTGNDLIIGDWGNDKIAGRDGNDTLYGDSPTDSLATGRDTILGGDGDDKITAGGGNDLVQGDSGNDFINGGGGNDFLLGGSGNDSILGGAGNDTLVGEDGDDTLNGQGGTDTVVGGRGLGTATNSPGDKRIGETINELFKITTARPSIFSELDF